MTRSSQPVAAGSPLSQYQICILGQVDWRLDALKTRLLAASRDLGLSPDAICYVDEAAIGTRDRLLPNVAIFFGYSGASDGAHPALPELLKDSTTIITTVAILKNAKVELPPLLAEINALAFGSRDRSEERLATLVLESFRLLRRERRLFISYKRDDSQALADRLYDALDQRGFDVFIDTRKVPPAVDFQSELWHRLADSDLVVLIDTPHFRSSRWTTEELAKANATNIQILHLLWPGQAPDPDSAFSEFFELRDDHFVAGASLGGVSTVKPEVVTAICDAAESLRARAMAARYRYVVDNFCDMARDVGLAAIVQSERWILLKLPSGRELAVVPAIGVPTSKRINEVFEAITALRSDSCEIWLLYDNRGLLGSWLEHLDWLGMHLPVKTLRVSAATEELSRILSC